MIADNYNFKTVRDFLLGGLSQLKAEPKLFEFGINERTLTQRLSMKLQPFFDNVLSVDCEYNRMWNGSDMTKKLPHPEQTWTNDDDGRTVFPDVIVHVRGEPFENLLVIEAKRNHRGDALPEKDRIKLELFTHPDGDFRYRWGAFVNFHTGNQEKKADVVWFCGGVQSGDKDCVQLE